MKKGDYVNTPRFLRVKIKEVFDSEKEARMHGFRETTHYWDDDDYGILGKSLDMFHMEFAAFKKKSDQFGG